VVAYFAMNLCLAVIEDVYSNTVEDEDDDLDSPQVEEFIERHLPKMMKKDTEADYGAQVKAAMQPQSSTDMMQNEDYGDAPTVAVKQTSVPGGGSRPDLMQQQSGSELIHGHTYSDGGLVNNLSTYAMASSRPKEQLKVGRNVGRIKNDPLEDAHEELLHRQRTALRAIAKAHHDPDPYYLQIKDKPFLMVMRKISKSERFNYFVLLVIVANTVILAANTPVIDQKTADIMEVFNMSFTVFFTIEAIIKILGLGIKGYLSDSWNVFDAIIVVVSDVELVIQLSTNGDAGGTSALRAFRLLRVLRLLGQFESLRIILGSVMTSFGDVTYLVMILGLFIFMFSTLGISLFSKSWYEKELEGWEADGRWRFDNIYWTMVTVFQCITADAWNSVMFDAVYATSDLAIIYFVAVVVFGGFIVLNLFVAILLSRMGSEDESKWALEHAMEMAEELNRNAPNANGRNPDEEPEVETKERVAIKRRKIVDMLERRSFQKDMRRKQKKMRSNRDKHEMEGVSFMFFTMDNPIRKTLHWIVKGKWFDLGIDILILVNCVFLMLEDPAHEDAPVFEWANIIFTVIFITEMLMKMIALGCLPYKCGGNQRWKLMKDEMSDLYQTKCTDRIATRFEDHIQVAIDEIHASDPMVVEPVNLHKKGVVTGINRGSDGTTVVQWNSLKTMRFVFKHEDTDGKAYTFGSDQDYNARPTLEAVYFLKEEGVQIMGFVHKNDKVREEDGLGWHRWRRSPTMDAEIDRICRAHDMSNRMHNSYLSSKWNQLDAFVVFISVLGVIFPEQKMLRALRAIRPLRIAVRIKQIKVILSALVRAVPSMMHVIIFCFSFWLVLAILGMGFFGAQFSTCVCNDNPQNFNVPFDLEGFRDGIVLKTKSDCEALQEELVAGGEPYTCAWEDATFTFNNVFAAIHTLFVLATMSGWNEIMYMGVDTNGIDNLPSENNRPLAAMYFVIIIIICAFFSLNLIISVVVDNFQRIKNEQDGSALMTEEQRKWVQTRRLVGRLGLKRSLTPPKQPWRMTVFTIVMHPFFEPLILGCIILNTLTMTLEHYGAPEEFMKILEGLDTFYIVVFGIEAVLKITAYGWKQYIKSAWNKFDFFIVIVGFVSLLDISNGASINVLRLFRIGRVLRLINKAKTLRTLFLTLMLSIPSLWNIGLLLIVVFFVYSVIGMHLFGTSDDTDNWEQMDDKANFQNFGRAISTLFRVSSGDGWSDVYDRYIGDVADKTAVILYFVSFFLLGALVMVNLFIAVILDSFNSEKEAIAREQELKTIKVWRAIWQEYDTTSKGTLPAEDFVDILKCVPKPVGFLDEVAFREQLRERSAAGLAGDDEFGRLSCLYAIKAQPTDAEVMELLIRLKMFVEKKKLDGKDRFQWCVDYEDALAAYATMLVELDIDIQPRPEANVEFMGAAEWFAQANNCTELCADLLRKMAQEDRAREMAQLAFPEFYGEQGRRTDELFEDGDAPPRTTSDGGVAPSRGPHSQGRGGLDATDAAALAQGGVDLDALRHHQRPQSRGPAKSGAAKSSGAMGWTGTAIEMTPASKR